MPWQASHWNGNVIDTSRIDREVSIPVAVPVKTCICLSVVVLRHNKSWSRVSNSTCIGSSGLATSLLRSLYVNSVCPGIGVVVSGMLFSIARVSAFPMVKLANSKYSDMAAPQAGMLTSPTISSNWFKKASSGETSLEPVTSAGVASLTIWMYAQYRKWLSWYLGSAPLTRRHRFAKVITFSRTEEVIPIHWACKEIGDSGGKLFSLQYLMTTVEIYHVANV